MNRAVTTENVNLKIYSTEAFENPNKVKNSSIQLKVTLPFYVHFGLVGNILVFY